MVVDDLHDADQPSLKMLRFVAREAKDVAIAIVGTYRDAEVRQSPELGKLIGQLIREGHSIPITGPSQAEVGEFVERGPGHRPDERLVGQLYRSTDGNPLFVDGVVRLLAAEGKLDQASSDAVGTKIPHGVRKSIRRRLVKLSEETNQMLSIASVIGNDFETLLLRQVSGSAADQVIEWMEEAGTFETARRRWED